jgi:hypothetical protein
MIALLIVVGGLVGSTTAWADDHIQGVIIGRTEGGVVVQTDSARLTIGLSDATRINRTDGIRLVPVGSADLIPGLRIKAQGLYDAPDKLAAKRVSFSREDFRIAAAIQGGVTPTDQRSLVNEKNIQENRRGWRSSAHDRPARPATDGTGRTDRRDQRRTRRDQRPHRES